VLVVVAINKTFSSDEEPAGKKQITKAKHSTAKISRLILFLLISFLQIIGLFIFCVALSGRSTRSLKSVSSPFVTRRIRLFLRDFFSGHDFHLLDAKWLVRCLSPPPGTLDPETLNALFLSFTELNTRKMGSYDAT